MTTDDFRPDCRDPLFAMANEGHLSMDAYRMIVFAIPVPTEAYPVCRSTVAIASAPPVLSSQATT